MMCLNCLTGLHNLCLGNCKCLCHHASEMEVTVRDLKEFENYKERKATQSKQFSEFPQLSAEELEYALAHVTWLREMAGRFPKRKLLVEAVMRARLRSETGLKAGRFSVNKTHKCRYCHTEAVRGTLRKDHGIGKCVSRCEECNHHKATFKDSEGVWLCDKCIKDLSTIHRPVRSAPSHAPVVQNAIIYDRPAYVKPIITWHDAYARHADYMSEGEHE